MVRDIQVGPFCAPLVNEIPFLHVIRRTWQKNFGKVNRPFPSKCAPLTTDRVKGPFHYQMSTSPEASKLRICQVQDGHVPRSYMLQPPWVPSPTALPGNAAPGRNPSAFNFRTKAKGRMHLNARGNALRGSPSSRFQPFPAVFQLFPAVFQPFPIQFVGCPILGPILGIQTRRFQSI